MVGGRGGGIVIIKQYPHDSHHHMEFIHTSYYDSVHFQICHSYASETMFLCTWFHFLPPAVLSGHPVYHSIFIHPLSLLSAHFLATHTLASLVGLSVVRFFNARFREVEPGWKIQDPFGSCAFWFLGLLALLPRALGGQWPSQRAGIREALSCTVRL